MPEEYSSPEEKLLRLIRGEKKPKDKTLSPSDSLSEKEKAVPPSEDTRAGSSERAGSSVERRAAAVPQKRNITARALQPKDGHDYIRFINIALIAILVIITVVLLSDAINFNSKRPVHVTETTPRTTESLAPRPQPSTDIPSNADALIERDLFRPPVAAPATNIPQASYEKLKDLSLKGIIAGDKPQAIIEDEKNKKSFFLYKGESINDITVEDIQSDRVILRVNGEVLELTL